MPRCKTQLKLRNQAIVKKYQRLRKKHPKWTYDAVVQEVADAFYLSASYTRKILNSTPFPKD